MKNLLVIIAAIVLLAVACKKGELPKEHYYGKVAVAASTLYGNDSTIVFVNEQLWDTLPKPAFYTPKLLPSGVNSRLTFYDLKTRKLIADTTLTPGMSTQTALTVANNPLFNVYGFTKSGTSAVPKDSMDIQLFFDISDATISQQKVDIEMTWWSSDYSETFTEVIHTDVSKKTLTQKHRFRVFYPDAPDLIIERGFRLIDPVTKQYIDTTPYYLVPPYADLSGKTIIVVYKDDEPNNPGQISTYYYEGI